MRLGSPFFTATALALILLGGPGSGSTQASPILYSVSVDTSSLSGLGGNLDFQFNPGGVAEAATATVTNFQMTGGVLALSNVLTGDASGLLPGTLTLDNGTGYNDIFQGITFGNNFSFTLTLSGPAVDTPGGSFGSSFALSLYNLAGDTPLLTTDPNGSVLTINLNPNGTTSVETFSQSMTNNSPVAGASQVSAVPEPSSLVLFVTALPAGLLVWRRLCRASLPCRAQND